LRLAAGTALALAVAGGLASGTGLADPIEADAWESPPPADLHDCADIDGSLIVAVPTARRPEAIARLETLAIVELTPPELPAVLDLPDRTTCRRGPTRK
jgi:hypothetical protein